MVLWKLEAVHPLRNASIKRTLCSGGIFLELLLLLLMCFIVCILPMLGLIYGFFFLVNCFPLYISILFFVWLAKCNFLRKCFIFLLLLHLSLPSHKMSKQITLHLKELPFLWENWLLELGKNNIKLEGFSINMALRVRIWLCALQMINNAKW